MSEYFAQPDDLGEPRASDLHTSLGQSLGAQAMESFGSGFHLVGRSFQYFSANHGLDTPPAGWPSPAPYLHPGEPDVSIDDAKQRVKDEGLDGLVKLPEQPTIRRTVLDLMVEDGHEKRNYDAAVSRGPQGFFPGAAGLVTSIGAGIADPVNMAAFSVPVLGEARAGQLLARAGESMLARGGVRAGIGAAQGAAGTTLLQPADWWLHTQDGQDFTMADALRSIAMGAGMGAVAHSGLGLLGDVRARLRGLPLEGSPEDLVMRGLMREPAAGAIAEPPTPLEEVPGISVGPPPIGPPAEGFTRFYHGAAAGSEPTTGPRWVTPHLDYARGYAGDTGEVHFVDIANDSPHLIKSFDDTGTDQVAPFVHFEAPAEITKGFRLLERRAPAAVHPSEVFADLPPTAREDLVHVAAADVIADRPGRAGDVLAIAAQHDPRIAESTELGDRFPRTAKVGESTVHFPDAWHAQLFDVGERLRAGNTPTAAELRPMLERLKPYVENETSVGDKFDNLRDLGELAMQYRDDIVDQASAHRTVRAGDVVGHDFREAWLKRVAAEERARQAPRSPAPASEGAVVLPGPKAARGPRSRDQRSFSLFEFLAHRGGLAPDPELATIFGGKNPFVPGFGRLIRRTGMKLDRAREAAVEAGYLSDAAQQHGGVTESTVNHLLEAVDTESRGNRVYRAGEERAKGADRDEQLHHINREIDGVFTENGLDPKSLPDKTRRRVVEMMDRERVSDPLEAYERALLEEDRNGTEQGQHPADQPIPGWDVPEDAGGAPGTGGRAAERQPGAGGAVRQPRVDDRAAAAADPAWRRLADQRDPDDVAAGEASRAADKEPEPASVDPAKAPSAAEKAAADADALLKDLLPLLSEEERTAVTEALDKLKADREAREQIVRDGTACLLQALA